MDKVRVTPNQLWVTRLIPATLMILIPMMKVKNESEDKNRHNGLTHV
jgi:hypothetical protein